jgi:hypothetical protein
MAQQKQQQQQQQHTVGPTLLTNSAAVFVKPQALGRP